MRTLLLFFIVSCAAQITYAEIPRHDHSRNYIEYFDEYTGQQIFVKFKRRSLKIKGLGRKTKSSFRQVGNRRFSNNRGFLAQVTRNNFLRIRRPCGSVQVFRPHYRRYHSNDNFYANSNVNLDGVWESSGDRHRVRIKQFTEGLRVQRIRGFRKDDDWVEYKFDFDSRRFTNRKGQSIRILNDEELLWIDRNTNRELKLYKIQR